MLASFSNQRMAWRRAVWLLAWLATAGLPAHAHEEFAEFVRHRLQVQINARHIDVTLELTFFERWSGRERQHMDANQDGRIQRAELEAYANNLAATVGRELSLLVGPERLTLIPLYAPELNLLGREAIEGGHHQLTLRFFAAAPKALAAGATIMVEDRLWGEAQTLAEIIPATGGRFRLEPAQPVPRETPGKPLTFSFRCLEPAVAAVIP